MRMVRVKGVLGTQSTLTLKLNAASIISEVVAESALSVGFVPLSQVRAPICT